MFNALTAPRWIGAGITLSRTFRAVSLNPIVSVYARFRYLYPRS
jgi:hypothetical protein